MNKILKVLYRFIFNPELRFSYLTLIGLTRHIPDEDFLRKEYYYRMGKQLNLDNPITFTEKLQWLKLYDRRKEYTMMVDKAAVKQYVSQTIGDQYIIPTIGVWKHFDDINFDKLPEKFVLKCTHDSGGIVICKDKSGFKKAEAKKKLEFYLRRKYFYMHREWPYKDVEPKIIAEKYMEDTVTGELRDYKFFTFNGIPKALFIATGRQKEGMETTFDFFDMNYNHLDIKNGHPNATTPPEMPVNFEKMKELAGKLSKGIPHVRVDFYECNGRVYFGELTFSHWSGMVPFEPEEWDYTFGSWIDLPIKST